uniref:Uncharacterized protein n=1 Tax=Arundo donax TaxID=35708 RepID=A0A0A9EYD9_ARUDO
MRQSSSSSRSLDIARRIPSLTLLQFSVYSCRRSLQIRRQKQFG